jgi:excisionase family DNA binding protein
MDGKLLTIDEVAAYLGVHRDTVYSMVRSGRLPAIQLGGRKAGWRVSEEDLTAFVNDGKTRGSADAAAAHDELEEFVQRQRDELDSFQKAQQDLRDEFIANRASRIRNGGDIRTAPKP